MPLSEDEQRQLQQIEHALYRDDPKFGRLMRVGDPRVHCARMLMRALPGVVIGNGMLVAGAVTHGVYLEAAGVMIVLRSMLRAVVSWRRYGARVWPARPSAGTKPATGTKRRPEQTWRARMIERVNERWRRRRKGDGGMPARTRS